MSEKCPQLEIIQKPAQGLELYVKVPFQQREPGRHHATARQKPSQEVNIVVMECYYRSNPIDENRVPLKGYRQKNVH